MGEVARVDEEASWSPKLHADTKDDIEKEHINSASTPPTQQQQQPPSPKHATSSNNAITVLALYFLCNVSLTLYNKTVLGVLPVPWLLTAVHTGSASIGCFVAYQAGYFKLKKLDTSDQVRMIAFSILFTVNIAMSNVSLSMVSIPFHQIARATCPLFTTLIYRIFFSRRYTTALYLSLVPVTFGVALAAHGNVEYTPLGFAMTFLGVILAVIKTIMTNRVLTGSLALSHWELLLRMSPLAFVQSLTIALYQGEGHVFRDLIMQRAMMSGTPANQVLQRLSALLAGNGVLAMFLNATSFHANKLAGALTITVCGNLKQCVTIVAGFCFFDAPATPQMVCGVTVTVLGSVAYNFAELRLKQKTMF